MLVSKIYHSKWGSLKICVQDDKILSIQFSKELEVGNQNNSLSKQANRQLQDHLLLKETCQQLQDDPLLEEESTQLRGDRLVEEACRQLQAYEQNPNFIFNLPLQSQGTTFQNKVWQALLKIPSGQTKTYLEIAQSLQNHPRAVGQACKRNPWIILVPCHRVVAQDHLGGYAGEKEGTSMWQNKKELLQHESPLLP